MSRIRANQITNKTADGATTATNGFNVTGVCTATSFSGDGSALQEYLEYHYQVQQIIQ